MAFKFSPRWQQMQSLITESPDRFFSTLEDRERQIEDYLNYGEQTYTLTVTSTGTAPNFGSTALSVGVFSQIGRMVFYQFDIIAGGTGIANGTGTYLFSLPISPARLYTVGGANVGMTESSGFAFNGVSGYWRCNVRRHSTLSGGAFCFMETENPATTYVQVGAAAPFALAASAEFNGGGRYMIDE